MATKQRLLQDRIEEYLELLKKEKRSERTLESYRRELGNAFSALEAAGLEISPKKVGKKEIEYLRQSVFKASEKYNRWRLSILGSFLNWCGNNIMEKMRIGWPNDMRINANWLEPEEAMTVKNCAEGIEKVIVHLELDLALRRVEVIRLKPEDFKGNRINVLGKGRMGGKLRTIPIHEDTKEIIGAWLLERKRIIEQARAKRGPIDIPPNLLIYERYGRLHAYQKGAIDNFLIQLRKRVESIYARSFDFSNHTLRRTGGRMMWQAGVKLETISAILGHEDTSTTIDYLGLNYDDMSEGMKKLAQYQRNLNCRQNGKIREYPDESGGPKEIWTLDLPVISRALQPG